MAPMASIMRAALAVMVLGGAQIGGLAPVEARLAQLGDGIAAEDLGIMAGAQATRQLRQVDVSEDGEVSVGGTPVANVTTGEDGGQLTTTDGTVVGAGPDGAGAQGSDGTGVGIGPDGGGVGTSEGTGVGIGTDGDGIGGGVGASDGTGVGFGPDGAGGSTSSGEGFSVSDDGAQVDGSPTEIADVTTSGVATGAAAFNAPLATAAALLAAVFAA